MKKILIPVDGSDHSLAAVEKADALGFLNSPDTEVFLVSVIADLTVTDIQSPDPDLRAKLIQMTRDKTETIMKHAEGLFSGKNVTLHPVIRTGNVAKEILKIAEDEQVDMIIMGNRGLGAFSGTLLGSVSSKVLSHAKCSVLIVK